MKVVKVDYNDYGCAFVSVEIEGNERATMKWYKHGEDISIYGKDKADNIHPLSILRDSNRNSFNPCQQVIYKDTYSVGYGYGCFMGWDLELSKRLSIKVARCMIEVLKDYSFIGGVYITNIEDFKNKFDKLK